MTAGERPEDRDGNGGDPVSDEELLRWAGGIAKTRGRVQAARDVGLNYRTLARALDDQTLTRVARETLLEAHRTESAVGDQPAGETGEADEELTRRLEAAESQLADALAARSWRSRGGRRRRTCSGSPTRRSSVSSSRAG